MDSPIPRRSLEQSSDKSVQKGILLCNQAEGKLKEPKGFFENLVNMLAGPDGRKEEAIEKLQEAITHFKLAKEWMSAGEAYNRMLAILPDLSLPETKIANTHLAAAHCYLKQPEGYPQGLKSLSEAARIFSEAGDWHNAFNTLKQIAEFYEANDGTETEIIDAWLKAADINEMDNSYSHMNECLRKVAPRYCDQGKYLEAAQIYEQIAANMVKDEMLKVGAKEPFKNALLCRFALGDIVSIKKNNLEYCRILEGYQQTRECKLIDGLVNRLEEQDPEKFEQEIARYHKFTPFDKWQLKVLEKIHKELEEHDGEVDLS